MHFRCQRGVDFRWIISPSQAWFISAKIPSFVSLMASGPWWWLLLLGRLHELPWASMTVETLSPQTFSAWLWFQQPISNCTMGNSPASRMYLLRGKASDKANTLILAHICIAKSEFLQRVYLWELFIFFIRKYREVCCCSFVFEVLFDLKSRKIEKARDRELIYQEDSSKGQ